MIRHNFEIWNFVKLYKCKRDLRKAGFRFNFETMRELVISFTMQYTDYTPCAKAAVCMLIA